MNTKTAYQTDREGCYIGPTDADEDPMNPGEFLAPGGAYFDAPPDTGEREVARRVGGKWVVAADWRGFAYYLPDGSRHVIERAGVEPPAGWLAEQPVIERAEPVPFAVSRFQARAALLLEGLLDRVEAHIEAPQTDALVKLAWREATEFRRESLTVVMLASVLGLTSDDLDNLFRKAAAIVV